MRRTKRTKQRQTSRSGRTPKFTSAGAKAKSKKARRSGLSLAASSEGGKPGSRRETIELALSQMKNFYRPLKSPVTLRLDADVLAWFKKDGSRYQTRINQALRQVMEDEIKG
jgi:uncharacterized protein (DUF4415 family)